MALKKFVAAVALCVASVSTFATVIEVPDLGVLSDTTVPFEFDLDLLGPSSGASSFAWVYTFKLAKQSDVSGVFSFLGGEGSELDEVRLNVNRIAHTAQVLTLTDAGYTFSFKGAEAGDYMLVFRGDYAADARGFQGSLTATSVVPEASRSLMFLLGGCAVVGLTRRRMVQQRRG